MRYPDVREVQNTAKSFTLIVRRQIVFVGHLARMDEGRLQLQMLAGRRVMPGMGAAGCRGPSLMGVFGPVGVYRQLLDRYLNTREARREFFGGRRGLWWELAQQREEWGRFGRSITSD